MSRSVYSGAIAASIIFVLVVAPAFSVRGEEWTFPGARYQGMGGAGVAVVNDSHASYWNPGALAFKQAASGVELPFSFSTETLGDILADADTIADFINDNTLAAVFTKVQAGTPLTLAEVRDLLDLAVGKLPNLGESGEGFLALPDLGLVMRKGRLAISLRGTGSLAVDPVLDLSSLAFSDDVSAAVQVANVVGAGADHSGGFTNLGSQSLADAIAGAFADWSQDQAEELIFQSELAGLDTSAAGVRDLVTSIAEDTAGLTALDLAANGSGALIRGLITQEVGIAYAHPIIPERLGVGTNVRYLRGIATSKFIQYDDIKSGRDLVDELSDLNNTVTSSRVAMDVGVLLRPNDRWRFGVVARNLNGPDFPSAEGGDYTLEPQVRAGVALNLLPGLVLAADVDITENESEAIEGINSRLLSVGTEYRLGLGEGQLALRAGAFTNLAQNTNETFTLTAGLGFRIWRFEVDLAVAAAPDFQEVNAGGTKFPSRLNVSGSLRWVTQF